MPKRNISLEREFPDIYPHALATIWPKDLSAGRAQGACIASTRVVLEVLGRYGIEGRPMPCSVSLFNQEAARLAAARVPMDRWPPEAWSVGVAAREDPSPLQWDAHLVAEWRIGGVGGLLDADLGFQERLDYDMPAHPVSVRYSRPKARTASCEIDGRTSVIWKLEPHLTQFKQSSAWRDIEWAGDLIDSLVDQLADAVADYAAELRDADETDGGQLQT
jgi:hypothetical protein